MKRSAIEHLEGLASTLRTDADRLVIDADTHITDVERLDSAILSRYKSDENYYHGRPISAEELLAEMDMASVDMALIWQNPATTPYTADLDKNSQALLEANRYIHYSAMQYQDRFIPAGWVDPKSCGVSNSLALVDTLVQEFGFPVIKMNPAQNRYPIDSPQVLTIVDHIVEIGAVPAFHFGADTEFTPAAGLRRVAERHPDHPIIAVHMGGGGAAYLAAERLYHDARLLGLAFPNIRYVFSSLRETHIENALIAYQLAGEPFSRNLFCASDAPYGRVSWNFGGYRLLFRALMDAERNPDRRIRSHPGLFTPEATQNYLGGNIARFIADAAERLLALEGQRL